MLANIKSLPLLVGSEPENSCKTLRNLKYCSTSCSEEAPDLWKPAKPLITVPVVTWGKKLLVIA
jgi:hypothetical protein